MPFNIFGFQALWSPLFILFSILIIALYLYITTQSKYIVEGSQPVSKKEISAFVIAIVLLYIVKGSPIDLIGHILFSVHMTQMAILLMLVPPLLITGIPNWIWRKVIENKFVKPLFRFFTKPLLSLIVFSGLFSFYHIPVIFDVVKQNELYHILFTLLLFISSIFLWWPIINKLEGEHQVHGLSKIGYIIGSAILITPACALIIFADQPMYSTYTSGEAWLKAMELCVPASTLANLSLSGPELFTNMPVLEDQQLGGVVMKIIQEVIYGVILAMVFFQWYQSEQDNAEDITNKALSDRQTYIANK
ncbi:cytochrome c oxidase assembly factor CtaG [Paenisporosarcina sp. TG20]|uniref:cytochrome c oxidase assembly factor CtaG n=1 Tax=Paenisporosarcina sp. TG20 TaxID=1211706 RepID=UPI0003127DA9|nr:cytochrome c oxidase assembly factor CtaG [Paenisporosarcina sp. TG20]